MMIGKQGIVGLLLVLVSMASARDLSSGAIRASAENGATNREFGNAPGASAGYMNNFAQEGCDCTCDCPDADPDCTCVCDWCGDEVDQATMKKQRKQRRRRLGTYPPHNSLYF